VTHLANKVRLRYRAKLRLLGLWHRHPGSLDRFSSTDDETNRTYVRTCGGSAISGLVNIDPTFRMTFYVATGDPLRYDRIRVEVGDHNMPSQMLRVWDSRGLLQSLASLASESIAGQIPSNRLGNKPVGPIIAAPDRSLFDRLFRPIKPWRRAHTYLTNQQEVGGGDRVELSDCGKQSAVLDSIDQELAYLDRQQDYSYELSLQDGGVRVVLTRAMQIRECPSRLEFLFLIVDGRLSVCWGDQRYDYAPGITNTLVNKALGMFN